MQINIPIAVGELLDKISILEIKKERIQSKVKLELVVKELSVLLAEKEKLNDFPVNLYMALKIINEELWEIEDDIREKEAKKEFDEEFIELARSVYYKNDKRSELKKEINILYNSEIQEVKEYKTHH